MEQAEITWALVEEKTVRIELPKSSLDLTADELSAFIQRLGEIRMRMKPDIDRRPLKTMEYRTFLDPCWICQQELMRENSLLHLRDPRYGWLHFSLPREQAKKLGETLIQQAAKPGSGSTPGRVN
jgi:hypothetical protein